MTRFLLSCVLCFAALPAFAQSAALSFVPSGRGEYISGDQALTYTPANGRLVLTNGGRSRLRFYVSGDDGNSWDFYLTAPEGEQLQVGEYLDVELAGSQIGRTSGLSFQGWGRGCSKVTGRFGVRQLAFDSTGKITRLEAVATQSCDGGPPLAIAATWNAPALNFAMGAPDFGRTNRTYYGDTSTFSLVHSSPGAFRYAVSGQRDKWTMNFAVPPGQAQFAKGVYLTEGVAAPGVAGMDVALGNVRRGEYGKLEILSIAYKSGAIAQVSARFWFYGDIARTKLLRSGRINYWK